MAHGGFCRFPAPATAEAPPRQANLISNGVQMELVTPYRSRHRRNFCDHFRPAAADERLCHRLRWLASARSLEGQPNRPAHHASANPPKNCPRFVNEEIFPSSKPISDDMNPQIYGYLPKKALAAGRAGTSYTTPRTNEKKIAPVTPAHSTFGKPQDAHALMDLVFGRDHHLWRPLLHCTAPHPSAANSVQPSTPSTATSASNFLRVQWPQSCT